MRNDTLPKIKKIISLGERLPYFRFETLLPVEKNKNYLKILFSRYQKAGKLIRLKRGIYTTKEYLDALQKSQRFSSYLEFLANILYSPSYLSLEYILYQHNLLTELPVNFTSIAKNKTANFSNKFGNFFYHKIKDELFCGYEPVKEGDFIILKATPTKALFDFLYLRKNLLINEKAVEELRLNLENLVVTDLKEFKKYLHLEGSKKMRKICRWIFK